MKTVMIGIDLGKNLCSVALLDCPAATNETGVVVYRAAGADAHGPDTLLQAMQPTR
jgi:hypothetical protein